MLIAYVGFVQSGSIRCFNFEGSQASRPGYRPKHVYFSMTADLTVVSRLRVKFQDLPGLCMRTLSAAVGKLDESDNPPGNYVLTEADVHAYCASMLDRPIRPEHRKRFRPKPSENSQFQWPRKA